MQIKDFNTINLSLEQKKLLKKKIGQGGGSASDNSVPIFYVMNKTNTIDFKLIQGKPKVNEWGDLQPIICIDYSPNSYIYLASVLYNFFTFKEIDIDSLTIYTYSANKSYVDDFLALNVGDVLTIDKSELKEEMLYGTIDLQFNKNFGNYSFYMNKLQTLSVTYYSNGVTLIGHVIKVDQTNHNLYLSIGDEVWKYSYTGGGMTPYSDITFVEVVQS